jgi:RHS repeat-associated protein
MYNALFSVENHILRQSSQLYPYPTSTFNYDPSGKRLMNETDPDPYNYTTGSNPTYNYNFYGITGQRIATVTCYPQSGTPYPICSVTGRNVYFKGKMLESNGVTVVTDRLGSVRANTLGENFAYYPYGEERTSTADGRDKFGTYFRDVVGQHYADQRYYGSSAGRFWTVDPGGKATSHSGTPGSWNRYSYGFDDPVNRIDPRGMDGLLIGYTGKLDCTPFWSGQYNDDETIDYDVDWSVCYSQSPGAGEGGVDGGGAGDPDPAPSCTQQQRDFVSAHQADAATAASQIGTSALDLLALSGYESGYGGGPYVAAQGSFTGNAFFNLEGEVSTQTSPLPTPLSGSTGWSKPSTGKNNDGKYAVVAGYANYLDSALSFIDYKGGLFANVTDPTAFGKIAASNGFGITVTTFVSIVNTLATCLH